MPAPSDSTCPNCRRVNREGARFCSNCGAGLEGRRCPHCGGRLTRTVTRFCEHCGRPLDPSAAQGKADEIMPPRPAALKSQAPPDPSTAPTPVKTRRPRVRPGAIAATLLMALLVLGLLATGLAQVPAIRDRVPFVGVLSNHVAAQGRRVWAAWRGLLEDRGRPAATSREEGSSPVEPEPTPPILSPSASPPLSISVTIRSSPGDASVQIDDVDVGTTPLTVSVAAGPHRVRIARPGFEPVERTVTINQGEPVLLEVKLSRAAQRTPRPPQPTRPRRLSPQAYLAQGIAYYNRQEYPNAVDAFNSALALNPRYAPAQLWLGHSYMRLGWKEEAVAAFERVTVIAPRSQEATTARRWIKTLKSQ